MNSLELINELKTSLSDMMEWAREGINDQYLDGDPDIRKQFVDSLEKATLLLKVHPADSSPASD